MKKVFIPWVAFSMILLPLGLQTAHAADPKIINVAASDDDEDDINVQIDQHQDALLSDQDALASAQEQLQLAQHNVDKLKKNSASKADLAAAKATLAQMNNKVRSLQSYIDGDKSAITSLGGELAKEEQQDASKDEDAVAVSESNTDSGGKIIEVGASALDQCQESLSDLQQKVAKLSTVDSASMSKQVQAIQAAIAQPSVSADSDSADAK